MPALQQANTVLKSDNLIPHENRYNSSFIKVESQTSSSFSLMRWHAFSPVEFFVN
uniref:Uncharacterized protein n=1 Tax=Arundo donax TaxID=35708 RepID=A0A0A9HBZ3_ARUDO